MTQGIQISDEIRKKIIQLKKEGIPTKLIAERFGLHKNSVYRIEGKK
jgi:transposase